MKVRAKQLSSKAKIETLDALYTAAASVHGRDAVKAFLKDLLTESERIMLGRRILIARRILEGATSREIAQELGVGLDTVSRIERWLDDQLPGYERAIEGLQKEHGKRARKADEAARFNALKRKYPLHFLLFPFAGKK